MQIQSTLLSRLVLLTFALTSGAGVVDGASVFLTRMTVPDDVRAAGLAATEVATNAPATRQTAAAAYLTAQESATPHGITVDTEDFTIYPDGRVTLTAEKTAPTLLLHRISALSHFTEVRVTVTVTALPFS